METEILVGIIIGLVSFLVGKIMESKKLDDFKEGTDKKISEVLKEVKDLSIELAKTENHSESIKDLFNKFDDLSEAVSFLKGRHSGD
jgi:peptidoglycan hydrolase CwlO-like protein